MSKIKVTGYSIYVNKKELKHLQEKHPSLLNQAYEYGYEYTPSEHHFYNQPKLLVDNLKTAIEKLYWPYIKTD